MSTGASDRPQHPEELLASYVEGGLDPSARDEVERHLAGCADCRADVALARAGRAALRELPDVAPPPEMGAGLRRALESPSVRARTRAPATTARSRSARSTWVGGLAAAAVIVALLAIIVPRLSSSGGSAASHGAASGTPPPASRPGAGTLARPSVERQDVDYDPAAVAALAADVAASASPAISPAAPHSPQRAAEAGAGEPAALTCAARWASSAERAELVRVIEASYQGTPAYIGVALQFSTRGAPRVLIWVLARQGCDLISYSERAA